MQFLVILGLMLGLSTTAVAGPFEDAEMAYQSKDYATALKLFQPLADQGDTNAQRRIGTLYDLGRGVGKDLVTAVKWYRQAADQGNSDAQNDLAMMYLAGSGVTEDRAEAIKWFKRAAMQGNPYSQANLGMMNELGNGIPKDPVKAYVYFSLSTAQNVKIGELFKEQNVNRDRVAALLSPDQIRKAQEITRTCLTSKYKTCEKLIGS